MVTMNGGRKECITPNSRAVEELGKRKEGAGTVPQGAEETEAPGEDGVVMIGI
jgi:hypothetical protein